MRFILVLVATSFLGCALGSVGEDCNALARVKHIPMKATYAEILATVEVRDSIELDRCLAQKIDDKEIVDDPSDAPPVASYVLGDTAFFLLALKYNWKINDFLDEPFRSNWAEQGVYAYFDYVGDDANRRRLSERVIQELQ